MNEDSINTFPRFNSIPSFLGKSHLLGNTHSLEMKFLKHSHLELDGVQFQQTLITLDSSQLKVTKHSFSQHL